MNRIGDFVSLPLFKPSFWIEADWPIAFVLLFYGVASALLEFKKLLFRWRAR